jgi:hypothetical protein
LTVHEPSTLITDLLLAAYSAWLGWRLDCRCGHRTCAVEWMARTLWVIAAAAVVGGLYHGFAANFPPAWADAWWIATLALTCLAAAALDLTLMHEFTSAETRGKWRVAAAFKLCASIGAAVVYPQFVVAIATYGLSLAAWLVAAVVARRPWARSILTAVGISVLAAVVQQARISPAAFFNHNDLYHALQAVALFGFYRAGRRLRAGVAPATAAA